jgi:hypothetical protein
MPSCTESHVGHEHHSEVAHNEDGHHHHGEDELINDAHSHIVHNDHFDDNVLDYLLCALKESKHHHEPCDLHDVTTIHEFAGIEKNADNALLFSSILTTESPLIDRPALTFHSTHFNSIQSLEYIEYCQHRGPPKHS